MSARMNVLAMVWGMAWVVGGTDWQDRKTLQPGIRSATTELCKSSYGAFLYIVSVL